MSRVLTMDLHTHLLEKDVNPLRFWKKVQEKKLDAIAITEHMELNPKKAFDALNDKKPKNIVLIPGAELFTEIGHVNVFGKNPEFFEIKELFEKRCSIRKVVQIVKKNNLMLSICHPWGFSYDSAAYLFGEKKLARLVEKNNVGVEAYNGMLGHLSNFIYDTNWVKKPLNFFDFLEKNRVARKIKFDKLGKKMKSKLVGKSLEVLERCGNAIELGNKASFITAGSDAHSPERVGAGILKIKSRVKKLNNENVLEEIKKKENVIWVGPYVKEIGPGKFQPVDDPLKKMEMLQALNYATKRFIIPKKLRDKIPAKVVVKKIKKIGQKIRES